MFAIAHPPVIHRMTHEAVYIFAGKETTAITKKNRNFFLLLNKECSFTLPMVSFSSSPTIILRVLVMLLARNDPISVSLREHVFVYSSVSLNLSSTCQCKTNHIIYAEHKTAKNKPLTCDPLKKLIFLWRTYTCTSLHDLLHMTLINRTQHIGSSMTYDHLFFLPHSS